MNIDELARILFRQIGRTLPGQQVSLDLKQSTGSDVTPSADASPPAPQTPSPASAAAWLSLTKSFDTIRLPNWWNESGDAGKAETKSPSSASAQAPGPGTPGPGEHAQKPLGRTSAPTPSPSTAGTVFDGPESTQERPSSETRQPDIPLRPGGGTEPASIGSGQAAATAKSEEHPLPKSSSSPGHGESPQHEAGENKGEKATGQNKQEAPPSSRPLPSPEGEEEMPEEFQRRQGEGGRRPSSQRSISAAPNKEKRAAPSVRSNDDTVAKARITPLPDLPRPLLRPDKGDEENIGLSTRSGEGGQLVTIQVTPPSLGPVTIVLSFSGNDVQARFAVENEETLQNIDDMTPLLRHSLQELWDVKDITVVQRPASSEGRVARPIPAKPRDAFDQQI